MSSELYEVISLAARYLFVLLGVLIVLRSFLWLLSDHSEKRRRLRRLPDSGFIGELVVVSGTAEIPEGLSVPVPWEGVLGSVRSCDIFIPDRYVHRKHLAFTFVPGKGLLIQPFSGCETVVNSSVMNCHSRPDSNPMIHGSYLQLNHVLLRLRVFAGLDHRAGFDNPSDPVPSVNSDVGAFEGNPAYIPESGPYGMPYPSYPESTPPAGYYSYPEPSENPSDPLPDQMNESNASTGEPSDSPEPSSAVSSPRRQRRSDRWEGDWSD